MKARDVILLTGANGQVGRELCRGLSPLGTLISTTRHSDSVCFLDLANTANIASLVNSVRPAIVINAAAYTAVDKAETDEKTATIVNGSAVEALAEACHQASAMLIHYSTDYVFDGSTRRAYKESDSVNPLSVYGRSKQQGEDAVLSSAIAHLILRTGWVYAGHGANFVLTMQRLARGDGPIRVVSDQFGTPTWARSLAQITGHVVARALDRGPTWLMERRGLYHVCAPDHTNWHCLAQEVIGACTSSARAKATTPIATKDYPLPATRPLHSVMDSSKFLDVFGLQLPPWRQQLSHMLEDQGYLLGGAHEE
ncbi:MAG: dTDP-4-dehydrorhamnose reductase [Rhodospirillaceae bacterium]|nr:dTDP-4-dehydrorhamnose reductase [Rhodospirillaceae bacterium]